MCNKFLFNIAADANAFIKVTWSYFFSKRYCSSKPYWGAVLYLSKMLSMEYQYWLNTEFTLEKFAIKCFYYKIFLYVSNNCNKTPILEKWCLYILSIRHEMAIHLSPILMQYWQTLQCWRNISWHYWSRYNQ